MSMDLRELNKIKLQLTKSLLERLEQLKKAMDNIANLQKILSKKESVVYMDPIYNCTPNINAVSRGGFNISNIYHQPALLSMILEHFLYCSPKVLVMITSHTL